MGRGDGGGLELAQTTVRKARHSVADKFDMKNKKAARHWLKKPLPPRESPAIGSALRQPRAQWPVRPAEPWWPGGALETVQQSEGILPAVGWLCVLPREERGPLSSPSSSSSRMVQTMRPYKCGPAPVFHSTGVKATRPPRSMTGGTLPPLAPRLEPSARPSPKPAPSAPKLAPASSLSVEVSPASPSRRSSQGHDSDHEEMIEGSPLGQLREAFRKMSSMNSVVTSIKSNPNPLLERRRSSIERGSTKDEHSTEQDAPKDGAKMLLRMMNLEVKTRQSHRREKLLRGVFDAMSCQVQLAKRARKTFTDEEAQTVHAAFVRCAGHERSELPSENALFSCLLDLGLTGTSVAEKQEVWRQIAVAFGNPLPAFEEEVDEATMHECDKLQGLVRRQGDGVCEQELILYVMPAIRLALQELVEDEMDQRLHRLDGGDRDVSAVPVKLCARVARLMGVDIRLFTRMAQEIAQAEGHSSRQRGTEVVNISLEHAARAVVACRERVARKLRRRELPLKQDLCMTEAKIISSRPHLLELHLRFQERVRDEPDRTDETEVIGEDSVFRLFKEMGQLPSDTQAPDLGEFLHLDMMEVGRRFSFARVHRILETQRQGRLEFIQEELESVFAHGRRGAPALTPAAAAQALSQLHLNPVRREDQNDITNILAEAVGVNRHGALTFQSFQALCMRVQDRLSLLRYEAGFECGVVVGLSEIQVMNLWEAFHALEPPQEGLFKGVAHTSYKNDDEFESLDGEEPSKALVALDVGTMPTLANGFMTYISANAPRPLVQVTNGRYLCARLAERWTSCVLRKALRLLRLPSDYVQCLEDDELAPVLADHFGLPEATTCRSIGEALCLGTPEELHRKAQALGFAQAQLLGWEAVRAESSSVKLSKFENV